MGTPFLSLVAASLRQERFTLVDVGCAGGLEPLWRGFGNRLRAVGFDAIVDEVERLKREETAPDIHYIAGFTDLRADHPAAATFAGKPQVTRNPWQRLSSAWAAELRKDLLER